MTVTMLTQLNSKEFLEANKDAFVVLVFDADFTEQKDLVDKAVKVLTKSKDIKEKIVLATVDASENNDLATELSVLSVPMIVCLMKGKTIRKIDNLEPTKLEKTMIEELRKYSLLSVESAGDSKVAFKDYLKQLTNKAPVMIFMKGDPETPRCGFSRQLVELLKKNSVKYQSFDILQDEDVRQGLKEYSDWPTYPQIYVKGEFVGGLDVLKQLDESGELESTLKV